MKRLLWAPIRIFIFAVQYRMYGVIAVYVIAFGFIATWIRSGFWPAAISIGVIVACILILRGSERLVRKADRGNKRFAQEDPQGGKKKTADGIFIERLMENTFEISVFANDQHFMPKWYLSEMCLGQPLSQSFCSGITAMTHHYPSG